MPRWSVASEPELQLGRAQGDSLYEFFRVGGAVALKDGRIVVADLDSRIRVYAPDGVFLRAYGGRGEGPDEFLSLQRLVLHGGDTIVAYDQMARRLHWLLPDLRLARTTVLALRTQPPMLGMLQDGSAIFGPVVREWISSGQSLERGRHEFMWVDREGHLIMTLAEGQGQEQFVLSFPNGARGQRRLPFAPPFSAAASGSRLYVTGGASYSIERYDLPSKTPAVFGLPRTATPVTAEHLDHFLAAELDDRTPGSRPQLMREFAEMPKPEAMPLIESLLIDDVDHLWVGDYRPLKDRPARWTVFNAASDPVAEVSTPANFRPTHITEDRIVGVAVDELGVERITVLRLRREDQ